MRRRAMALALSAIVSSIGDAKAENQGAAAFWAGRQLSIIVGVGPGGGYDVYARLISRFLGRHVPGSPSVVVINMPGASSLVAANYVANVAPQDGTTIFLPVQTLPLTQLASDGKARFDLGKFNWIGNMSDSANTVFAWGSSGVKSLKDAQSHPLAMGATTPDSLAGLIPAAMNALLQTQFKIITGYSSGDDVDLALERGEVAGRAGVSWAALKSYRADWLRDRKINTFAQVGVEREPDLDAPLLTDLAQNDDQRRTLDFFSSLVAVGRALAAGPGVPQDRVAALRAAFDATMNDGDLRSEAEKEQLELRPLPGLRVQAAVANMMRADPRALERIRESSDSAKSK